MEKKFNFFFFFFFLLGNSWTTGDHMDKPTKITHISHQQHRDEKYQQSEQQPTTKIKSRQQAAWQRRQTNQTTKKKKGKIQKDKGNNKNANSKQNKGKNQKKKKKRHTFFFFLLVDLRKQKQKPNKKKKRKKKKKKKMILNTEMIMTFDFDSTKQKHLIKILLFVSSLQTMFQLREALIMYMMSLTDQVISIETLWNEIASFCDRFAAHRTKLTGAATAPACVLDDAVKKHCVRLLCTMGDEFIVVRRLVNASALPDSLRRTGLLVAADLSICARVDVSFVEKSSFDSRTVVVGATWAALVRGLGIAPALAQSVAPIANLTDKHIKLITIVAHGEFRGVLKSFADDQFGDDKKHVSYLVKHLVALGLLRKIDILRPGIASTTAILWLSIFAPPRGSAPELPVGYSTIETDAAQKHRITSKIAEMPNHIMTNRDIVACFALRKDRVSALREQLVNSGHVQLINAVDHSRERPRDASGGKEQRGLYCWRLLKVFEPKRSAGTVDDLSLTHFSTRPADAVDHVDDNDDANNNNNDDDGADGDNDDDGDNDGVGAVVDDGDADALPMRPLCLEMSLDDQILECIRDSGDRGLSAREVCTCLGLNSPVDMKKMVTTLAHLSRDYGFKSEAVYVGKVRFARFKWVDNVVEAAIAASADKFGASVEARARRIADVLAERRAISKTNLLQELRELERNPVLDRPTLERAMAHLQRNADQFGGAIRTENVRQGKRTITMFVAADAANNEPLVVAARKAIEDSTKVGSKVDELAVWGEVADYGEIARLDDAPPSGRAALQQRALAAANATPGATGAIGSAIELGLMLQVRVLHMAMCSLMAAAPRDGSDVVEVRRVDVFEQLTLDVLLRFFGKRVTQLPDALSDPRRSEMRLVDLEPAKREAVESALGISTSVSVWRRTVQVLLRIGLVDEAPGKAINDAACVRRSVLASLVPRDGKDGKGRPRRIAFDHSVALKNSMELRRFWMCFERLVRCEDTKSHDISGNVVVECARPAVWLDADRATRDSVLAKYAVLNAVASNVIAAITAVSDDVNIGALTRIAKDAKLTTNDVLTFADAYWRVDIERQDREAHKSEAAVASKRSAPSPRRAKRTLADEPVERRYLHMSKQSQRRALRRAVLLARQQLDDLEYADDDTEESETDSDDDDDDDNNNNRVRSRRMADSSDSDESDSIVADPPSRKRVRRSLKQRGAVASGSGAAASERGAAMERGVSAHLTPAQLLSFALVLASRFVERERGNSSAWSKSAPPIVPSTNVPTPLTMVDFGATDVWREVSAGLRCTRAQSREYFRSAMRTELFPAQLYTQIRRITARLGQHLQSKFAWLHAYVSPLVPDVPLPANVAQLRERCAVYELAPGSATFSLVDPFTVAASSFEVPDAAVLYVADLLLMYLASADDQFVLPIFATVPASLRAAALQRLRDRLITARSSTRKKQSDWLLERSIDGDRLASAARVRLERHLADVVNISVDEQRKLGKTTEPLLPLAVRDARALQQRLAATPNGVPFSAFEPPGSVLAMLEMVLHGDIAVTHELVPTQTASSSRRSGGARGERAYSLRVTLSERKLADAARDSTTVPFVVAARNEVLVDAAAVLTTLRDLPAARRAIAAAAAAGARGLTATELEATFVGASSAEWREQLATCDLFCSVGDVHYLHGTVAAALFTGDAAPLERVIDTTGQPLSMRYTLRRRDPASTPLPDGFVSAPPLPVESNGGRIARRAVLGHYERNPAVRATTLLERIDDATALMSRVATGDQLHWLALNHVLVSRRYTEQSWPSGRLCPRLMLSKSAHIRFYPPSAVLRLSTTQSATQSLPQTTSAAMKQQQ
jgi:hypothetical protein